MLKINLLPPYIYERKKIRAAWAVVVLAILAEVIALAAYQAGLMAQEGTLIQQVQSQELEAQKVQKLTNDAQAERGKITSIQNKVKFIKDLESYNLVRPRIYQNAAEYTFKGIRYTQMTVDGNLLTIQASAPSLSDAGRYLIYMQGNPDITTVNISGVPGYPPGNANEGAITSTLAAAAPAAGDSGGQKTEALPGQVEQGPSGPGGGGPGGMPGMMGPGGMPGMMGPGGMGMGPGGMMAGPAGPTGPSTLFGGGAAAQDNGPLPGPQAALAGGAELWGGRWYNARARLVRDIPQTGFPFTVTATLVEPIFRPVYGAMPEAEETKASKSGGISGFSREAAK